MEIKRVIFQGDSGGPILLDSTKEIIGINTAVCGVQKRCENVNAVSLHAKVRLYETFIQDVVKLH